MAVRILIDSSTNIPLSQLSGVEIIPLKVCFGETEYLDGVTINNDEFYHLLEKSEKLPITGQATPMDYEPYFKDVIDAGDDAVVISLSSCFSGTYQSACIAAADCPDGRIFVIDGKSVSIGVGIVVQYALQLREQGLSAAEIASRTKKAADRGHVIAFLDTLEYLQKGGRISKAASIAGTVLNIKPVVYVVDGNVQMLGKLRSIKGRRPLMEKEFERVGGIDFDMPILLGYTGWEDSAMQKFAADNEDLFSAYAAPDQVCQVGSAVGTHIGPGGVAVAYFGKEC